MEWRTRRHIFGSRSCDRVTAVVKCHKTGMAEEKTLPLLLRYTFPQGRTFSG